TGRDITICIPELRVCAYLICLPCSEPRRLGRSAAPSAGHNEDLAGRSGRARLVRTRRTGSVKPPASRLAAAARGGVYAKSGPYGAAVRAGRLTVTRGADQSLQLLHPLHKTIMRRIAMAAGHSFRCSRERPVQPAGRLIGMAKFIIDIRILLSDRNGALECIHRFGMMLKPG